MRWIRFITLLILAQSIKCTAILRKLGPSEKKTFGRRLSVFLFYRLSWPSVELHTHDWTRGYDGGGDFRICQTCLTEKKGHGHRLNDFKLSIWRLTK